MRLCGFDTNAETGYPIDTTLAHKETDAKKRIHSAKSKLSYLSPWRDATHKKRIAPKFPKCGVGNTTPYTAENTAIDAKTQNDSTGLYWIIKSIRLETGLRKR